MPRQNRYTIPGLSHHLFQRGHNKQNVFPELKNRCDPFFDDPDELAEDIIENIEDGLESFKGIV